MIIEIYTKKNCPYCDYAKELLQRKRLSYSEIKVDEDISKVEEMLQRSEGRRTVPQIFINGKGIGGYTDLVELDKQGKLT